MIKKIIKDDLLLIVPSTIKENIIKQISSLDSFFSCKVISENDLKKSLCFDYGINAIDYLANKLNINYDVAKEYIEAMYYIKDRLYTSDKLNSLNT